MTSYTYRDNLCELYLRYNRREFVHPDPLEFLYNYDDLKDREIVALIASSLAYGNVRQILKSVSRVLAIIGSPHDFVVNTPVGRFKYLFSDFKHRFTTGDEIAQMLCGVKGALNAFGSLKECFESGVAHHHETVIPALANFVGELTRQCTEKPGSLLPSPDRGSACKRLNLFLRWMIRTDQVDPGGWDNQLSSKLIIPLDIHMHRISMKLGLTSRKQANLRTACEVTAAFRSIDPQDPVRYDFALTRLGIRDDLDPEEFLKSCSGYPLDHSGQQLA